jgi:hypothetical protein
MKTTSRTALATVVLPLCAAIFGIAPQRAFGVIAISLGAGATSSGDDDTNGWRFQALNNISVTHLGAWDNGGNGLPDRVFVGIWNDAGTLLGQLTLGAGTASPLTDGFRYEPLGAPVALTAGQFYRVGSVAASGIIEYAFNRAITEAPDIDFDQGYFAATVNTLTFPNIATGTSAIPAEFFGANFQYVAAAIPEASSFVFGFAAIGLVGATWSYKRRRAA